MFFPRAKPDASSGNYCTGHKHGITIKSRTEDTFYLVQLAIVPRQDVLIVLLLQGGHCNPDDALLFRWQALLHILDDSAKEVGLQLTVQLSDLHTEAVFLMFLLTSRSSL